MSNAQHDSDKFVVSMVQGKVHLHCMMTATLFCNLLKMLLQHEEKDAIDERVLLQLSCHVPACQLGDDGL